MAISPTNEFQGWMNAIATKDVSGMTPSNRKEAYMYKAAGGNIDIEPKSPDEYFMNEAAEAIAHGGGGGGDNTKLIQLLEKNGTSFTLPKGLTKVSQCAFAGWTNLDSVDYSEAIDTLQAVEERAFERTGLTKGVIMAGINYGIGVYQECESMTEVEIHADVPESAFAFCGNIVTVNLPTDFEFAIGPNAFANTSINNLVIPNNVDLTHAHGAFNSVSESPMSVDVDTPIGDAVFSDNGPLTNVTLRSGVTSIGNNAFYDTSVETFDVPAECANIAFNAFNTMCTSITFRAVTPPTFESSEEWQAIGYSAWNAGDYVIESDDEGPVQVGNLAHIYVPAEAVEAYKNTPTLSLYKNIIEAIPA